MNANEHSHFRRAFRFFHENAGGVVGEAAIGAYHLSQAECWIQEDEDYRFHWTPDPDPDDTWMDDEERALPHECYGCILEKRDEDTGEWEHAQSLWGIFDPDDNYRRIVEAELALEELS